MSREHTGGKVEELVGFSAANSASIWHRAEANLDTLRWGRERLAPNFLRFGKSKLGIDSSPIDLTICPVG
jgi:hypothetical protein